MDRQRKAECARTVFITDGSEGHGGGIKEPQVTCLTLNLRRSDADGFGVYLLS